MPEGDPQQAAGKLIGVRLNQWLSRFPFYCLNCIAEIASEKGWDENSYAETREGGQAAVPIIRSTDGTVRHVRVTGSLSKRDWKIDDDDLPGYHGHQIVRSQLLRLGLRAVRSMPQPVDGSVRCKRCRVLFNELEPE